METLCSFFPISVKRTLIFPNSKGPGPIPKNGVRALDIVFATKSIKNEMAIAIDSRLSIAKVRYRQPAVSSEVSLSTAGCE